MSNTNAVTWPPELVASGWPSEPTVMFVPGRPGGWPAGTQRSYLSTGGRLLSTAAGWWEVDGFRANDRVLPNKGTAGSVLDLLLGGSTIRSSGDPDLYEPEDYGYLRMVTADANSLEFVGIHGVPFPDANADITAMAYVGDLAEFGFAYGTDFMFTCFVSDGVTYFRVLGTAFGSFWNYTSSSTRLETRWGGTRGWIAWTKDTDNGTGRSQYSAWWAAGTPDVIPSPSDWTLFGSGTWGSIVSNAYTTSIGFRLSNGNSTGLNNNAKVYRFAYAPSIGSDGRPASTLLLDINFDDLTTTSASSLTARTGQIVSIHRQNLMRKKSTAMPSIKNGGKALLCFGADDWLSAREFNGSRNYLRDVYPHTNLTWVWVGRMYGSSPDNSLLSTKFTGGSSAIGLSMFFRNTQRYAEYNSDDIAYTIANLNADWADGELVVAVLTLRRDSMQLFANNYSLSLRSLVRSFKATGSAFTINSGASVEFYAAAVFMRDLTSREISSIYDHYKETFPLTPGPDGPRKTALSSALGLAESNPVLDVLKDAVFYIDSRVADEDAQYARNLGWAGDALNARLGSVANIMGDTNDPTLIKPTSRGTVRLPGNTGNHIVANDEASLRVTGDIDLRFHAERWAPPSAITALLMKHSSNGTLSTNAYGMRMDTTRALRLDWREPGGTTRTVATTTSLPASATWIEVRATLTVATGQMRGYYRLSPGDAWIELGAPAPVGATSINAGTANLSIGASDDGTQWAYTGRVAGAQVWNGIEGSGGTKVLDVDCNTITTGAATSIVAATGQTLSIRRSATGQKCVALPSVGNNGSPLWLFGADDYMELNGPAQHDLLNFGPGDPFTIVFAARLWGTQNSLTFMHKVRAGVGFRLGTTSLSQMRISVSDGVSTVTRNGSAAYPSGQFVTYAAVRDASTQTLSFTGAAAVAEGGLDLRNFALVRLFRSEGTGYADGELYAALIFRRVLSSEEITTLTNFLAGRVA